MKNKYLLILITLVLYACDRPESGQSLTGLAHLAHLADLENTSSIDHCAIMLTPHKGTVQINTADFANSKITRRQQQVQLMADQQSPNLLAHMERLGWEYVAKARSSFDPGFYQLAEQVALCIASKDPDSFDAMLLRGHVMHNLHQFKQAEAIAQVLADQRGLWFDHALLGDVLTERGRLDEAVTSYQKMMDLRPGPQAYSRAAYVRWLTGDLTGAIEIMQLATRASDSRDSESAAWSNVRLALYYFQNRQYQEAAGHYAVALQLTPNYAPALLGQGRLLLAKGKIKEAINKLTKAADLNPLPEYQWALIDSLRLNNNDQLANVLESELLEKGAIEDPRTLALYLASTGQQLDKALALTEQELNVRADVFTFDALAWALNAVGRYDEAYEFIQQALAEKTPDARIYFHAGVIALANGETRKAQQWFNNVLPFKQMLLPSEKENFDRKIAALNRGNQLSSSW